MNEVIYQVGIPGKFISDAIELYDEAFGKKLSVAIKSAVERKNILLNCFMPEYAISAIMKDKLIGIAGVHTLRGSLVGGIGYKELIKQLGLLKGNKAALVFSLYERKPEKGELVMDGIAVRPSARGKGVGGKLLDMVKHYADQHGFDSIRLDVVDINPRAKKLYEQKGFVVVKKEEFRFLRGFLGFGGCETMKLGIAKTPHK